MKYHIRPYEAADQVATARVWHRAGLEEYTYLPTWQAFSYVHAQRVFAEVLVPTTQIWVGESKSEVVAFLAMNDSYIDRLYVDPGHQGTGWGSHLLEHAKALFPTGLELHTHQQNQRARAFYEQRGFVVVKFGVSPPPESAPDVEYRWHGAAP